MSKSAVTQKFVNELFFNFKDSIKNGSDTYLFLGDHISSGSTESDVKNLSDSVFQLHHNVFRNMIGAKKIYLNNVSRCVNRHRWVEGNVYSMYDDLDPFLEDKPYFVIVEETDEYNLFKCLGNNNGAPSTDKPIYLQSLENEFLTSSDGYEWLYLGAIDPEIFRRFKTDKYIPIDIVETPGVTLGNGRITQIKVDDPGKNYNNYISGKFLTTDILVNNQFNLPKPEANEISNFYKGTVLHITDPNADSKGQFRNVISSELNTDTGFVVITIDRSFTRTISPDTEYEISPEVRIFGDGHETKSAKARAIIDPNLNNGVSRVEILEAGENYAYAIADVATGVASDVNEFNEPIVTPIEVAKVRPIIPPPGGHGSNLSEELNARAISISVDLDDDLLTGNTFAQFGLLQDPLFARVDIETKQEIFGVAGNRFLDNEHIIHFSPQPFYNMKINGRILSFDESSEPGIYIHRYLSKDSNLFIQLIDSDTGNDEYFYSEIDDITASNEIYLKDESPWTDKNVEVYIVKKISEGRVKAVRDTLDSYVLTDVTKPLIVGELLIGLDTYNVQELAESKMNNEDFQSIKTNFIQATVCVGTGIPSFNPNDQVFQGESWDKASMKANVYIVDDNKLYLTNISGSINTSLPIISNQNNDNILPPPFDKYNGEFKPLSGKILFVRNDIPVQRSEGTKENIRVILEL